MLKPMRPTPRFFAVFALSCVGLPFLPLYLERTMVRSQLSGRQGDRIDLGVSARTLRGFLSDRRYMRPEQQPEIFLALNVTLMMGYATAIGVLATRRRR